MGNGQPLLPQLNASLPVPLLAIAGDCDMQFTPSAVGMSWFRCPAALTPLHAAPVEVEVAHSLCLRCPCANAKGTAHANASTVC